MCDKIHTVKLFIATRGTLTKAVGTAPKDGAPTVRLHASGTRVDRTGDKVYDGVLQKWVNQAKAGKVWLLDNHHAAFPCGISFDAEIVDVPATPPTKDLDGVVIPGQPASRELFVEFYMDSQHVMTPTILSMLDRGFEAQCSVGMETPPGIPVNPKGYDPDEQRMVGMIQTADLKHIAFTLPNDAAYQYADVESYSLKSLDAAREELPKLFKAAARSGRDKMKEQHTKAMEDASKARDEVTAKVKSGGAKDDMGMTVKAVAQRVKAGAAMCKDIMDDPGASPEDLRAIIAHLLAEGETDAMALDSYGAEPPPEAVDASKAAPVAADDAARLEDAAKAAPPVAAAEPGPPAAPDTTDHKALADHHAAMVKYHNALAPKEEAPAAPAAVKEEVVATKDDAVATKDAETMALKSMEAAISKLTKDLDESNKLIKSQGDLLQKVRETPDYSAAPARSNQAAETGERMLKSINPQDRDTVSRRFMTGVIEDIVVAVGQAPGDSGAV